MMAIEKKLEREFYREARRELARVYKQVRCKHEKVLWDCTGKTGICFTCGATVKRQTGGQG